MGDADGLRLLDALHLHWDGATLSTVYAPAQRGVSDAGHRTTRRGSKSDGHCERLLVVEQKWW